MEGGGRKRRKGSEKENQAAQGVHVSPPHKEGELYVP